MKKNKTSIKEINKYLKKKRFEVIKKKQSIKEGDSSQARMTIKEIKIYRRKKIN